MEDLPFKKKKIKPESSQQKIFMRPLMWLFYAQFDIAMLTVESESAFWVSNHWPTAETPSPEWVTLGSDCQ